MIITSTHGNCEEMFHAEGGEPNPLPTANPVPFHYVDDNARNLNLRDGGALEDIAPTILATLNVEQPTEMTGRDLREI